MYVLFSFTLCHIASREHHIVVNTYHKRFIHHVHGWPQNGHTHFS